MMYTPTPSARRPRPPSRSRPNVISDPHHSSSNKAPHHKTPFEPSSSVSSLSIDHIAQPKHGTPLSHAKPLVKRNEEARAERPRINASPVVDTEGISLGLDVSTSTAPTGSSPVSGMPTRRSVGLGLPSPLSSRNNLSSSVDPSEAEPSPPPPYGSKLPSSPAIPDVQVAPTPLRQDSGSSRRSVMSSRESSVDKSRIEERLRARRATDAAKAMGLEVDFGTSGSEAREWEASSEGDVSEHTLRMKLLEMKKQLRRRDTGMNPLPLTPFLESILPSELLVAAEVAERALQTHEELLQYLPSTVKARLPSIVHLFPQEPDHKRRRSSQSTSEASIESGPSSGHRIQEQSLHSSSVRDRDRSIPRSQGYTSSRHANRLEETGYGQISGSGEDYSSTADESTSSRRFRTVRANDNSRPYPHHRISNARRQLAHGSFISPRQAQLTAIQQEEADRQILALEQALNDARDGEENQRKLAARLRREVDKLNREFERAQEDSLEEKINATTSVATPGIRGGMEKAIFRPRSIATGPARLAVRPVPKKCDSFGWGSIAFPQFPSASSAKSASPPQDEDEGEPDLGDVSDRLRRVTPDGKRHKVLSPALSRVSSLFSAISHQESPPRFETMKGARRTSLSRSSADKLTLPGEGRKVRKKLSQTNFLEPGKATFTPRRPRSKSPTSIKPRLTVEAPHSPPSRSVATRSGSRSRSAIHSRTIRKSPWPSPHGSTRSAVSPDARSVFGSNQADPDSLSPAFASITSRMAAMSAFVSSALQTTPSRPGLNRSLGSELGSEYGDRPDNSLRLIEDALFLNRPSPSRTHLSVDDDGKSTFSDAFAESPAALPPRVSAALSSLALALAPYTSPHPSRRISGLPDSAYKTGEDDLNVFDDAFAMRKIRWADTTRTSLDLTSNEHFISESVFNVKPASASKEDTVSSEAGRDTWGSVTEHLSLTQRPRLPHLRHSSDGSIALAHRRRTSQQILHGSRPTIQTSKSYPEPTTTNIDEDDEGVWEVVLDKGDDEEDWSEPRTIPGRLVHDLICLMAILVDFVECAVVIIYRVVLDMRYGQRDGIL